MIQKNYCNHSKRLNIGVCIFVKAATLYVAV